MRKIAANYIFPITSEPIKNGVLVCADDGKIIEIIDTKGELTESSGVEFYNGILIPGLVNAHCHLELSHYKGKLRQKTRLADFLRQIIYSRGDYGAEEMANAATEADMQMYRDGIVAVGDISNTTATIPIKKKSKIKYHTFVEAAGLNHMYAKTHYKKYRKVYDEFRNAGLRKTSLTPHAGYSVADRLFDRLRNFAEEKNCILSIHNQESAEEEKFLNSHTGEIFDLFSELDMDMSEHYTVKGSPIKYLLKQIPLKNPALLVHNTYSTQSDIDIAVKYYENPEFLNWVLCPASNLFIEDKLPDASLFYKNNLRICIGTDSYSSNTKLSILEEMKVLTQNFSEIPFSEILKWATLGGAKALRLDWQFGSFEKDKTPGVNLIENFDFKNMTLKEESKIKRLL